MTHDLRRRVARRLMRLLFGSPATPSSEPLPAVGVHRILICHISHALGNALLLTPLIQELEATWPGAEIDIITRSQVGQVLYGHYASVHRVFQLPSHGVGHPRQWLLGLRGMRASRYDLAIDPDPQSQSGRLLLLLARATFTLGFSGPKKSGSVTHAIAVPETIRNKGQLPVFLLRRALYQANASRAFPSPDIRLDAGELSSGRQAMDRVLQASGPLTGQRLTVGVFANATGPKQRGREWWLPLLDHLQHTLADCQLVEIVPMFGRSLLDSRYPTYYSSDLRKLGGVLASLDAYISLDCGIMHLACASRVPTLGIFTTPLADEWGPYGAGNHVVKAIDLAPAQIAEQIAGMLEMPLSPGERHA
ncbi:MAG: lipopolysaccharide heptosyltransferase family protein [Rhodanobacter sp.]|nr:MAG: lipopolysaccharide heptosyltransferase family protein [Rhodanobacter sp.]